DVVPAVASASTAPSAMAILFMFPLRSEPRGSTVSARRAGQTRAPREAVASVPRGALQPGRATACRPQPRDAAGGAPLPGHAARVALPADPLRHPGRRPYG